MKVINVLAVMLMLVMCCIDSTSMIPVFIALILLIILGICMLVAEKMESKKKEEQEMTYMDEIMQHAYDTAKSFEGTAPPQGSLYIGSRIKNGDRTKYWRHDNGTLYMESEGEANLKRKAARDHRGNEKDRQI